ncbi:competence protein ComK [Virgibacillus kimchii]
MERGSHAVYVITYHTKAIIYKDSAYYHSRILEGDRERLVIHHPEKIIEQNCLVYSSALQLRKKEVKDILHSSSKLPIPICPEKGYFMIPTASTRKKDCVWLAYHHIQFYEQRDDKTYICFNDGTGIYVNISKNAFDMQYKRTSQVIVHYKRRLLFGRPNFPDGLL